MASDPKRPEEEGGCAGGHLRSWLLIINITGTLFRRFSYQSLIKVQIVIEPWYPGRKMTAEESLTCDWGPVEALGIRVHGLPVRLIQGVTDVSDRQTPKANQITPVSNQPDSLGIKIWPPPIKIIPGECDDLACRWSHPMTFRQLILWKGSARDANRRPLNIKKDLSFSTIWHSDYTNQYNTKENK